jgi:UDP-N-acetylglucosamine 4,6-dehydratase
MINWRNNSILVTGGTGSFGNFIVSRLLKMNAREVRVFSRDEKKQYDMRTFYKDYSNLTFVIGDIRDKQAVDEAMVGINIVFQAAALKQVPNCESFPMEAIKTNIIGAENVVQSAIEHGVERLVAISTDKAVKPVNVMGMTKALQERLVLQANLSRSNKGTICACVRYGNVLRSRGSVIPFFRDLIKAGRILPITHEKMTRFFLTLNDAIDLVIYAAENANSGEIFVRKAPAAFILDVAKTLCDEMGVPLEYNIIGILPGEKLNEILISEEELERTSDCGDYYKIIPWWATGHPCGLDREFSSSQNLLEIDKIKELISRADRDFESMEVRGGEYARF